MIARVAARLAVPARESRAHTAAACVVVFLAAGCHGGSEVAVRTQLDEMNRVRESAAAKEASTLAPQAYARAEEARRLALQAEKNGDETGASLEAERAIAGFSHAFVLARLAQATRDDADAKAALAKSEDDARQLASAREAADREGDDLDKQVKVAREALAPPPSGPVDPAREGARLVAARALATQARLLCGAARLVGAPAGGSAGAGAGTGTKGGLDDAERSLDDLDKTLAAPRGGGIDAAARARAGCLALLSKARRENGTGASGQGDALLAELSASAGWEPVRDERGVVVTLRSAFNGAALIPAAEAKLGELGRVAAAHPTFGVQVVVHDADAPTDADRAIDQQRADACVKALVAAGAASGKVHAELAGSRAPVVDPNDAAHRSRNARVEIVFVAPRS